jgi:Flp pilus assembly protein TadD
MAAIMLQTQNKWQEAKQRYQQVLTIDSRAPVAANNLAMIYLNAGENVDLALQLAQVAKSQLPDNAEVNDTLGWAYYRKGLPSLAIAPLRASVAKEPNRPDLLAHLGLAYAKNGQRVEAVNTLRKALASGQNFPDAKEANDALTELSATKRTS